MAIEYQTSACYIGPSIQLSPYPRGTITYGQTGPKRILVTGAAGFFSSHFIEHILKNTDWDIIAMVRLGKVGTLHRLTDIECWEENRHRINIIWHDFRSPINKFVAEKIGHVDYIVHAGGETHVDRSIDRPLDFVESNVLGTFNMLEYARTLGDALNWFVYFSTDEVYGPADVGVFHTEQHPYNATNPYSATKAGAEQLVNAFGNTYNLPVFTTNTMNLFGERQHPEKFIPLIMHTLLNGHTLVIHSNADMTQAGSRFYLHCRNAAAGLLFLLENAEQRGRYNLVGEEEVDNLVLAELVHSFMKDIPGTYVMPLKYEMADFHSSRPGHDLRYALDGSKLKSMGFDYLYSFRDSLRETVEWTLANREWLDG
jgi:dTDP-glucose 4,6-dehydratase